MMRRGFLATLLGAPLIAGQAASGAVSTGLAATASVSPVADEPPKWRRHFWKANRAREKRHYAQNVMEENMHVSVRTKKSWSPAFKASVQAEIDIAFRDGYDMSDEEAMQWMIKQGLGHLLK